MYSLHIAIFTGGFKDWGFYNKAEHELRVFDFGKQEMIIFFDRCNNSGFSRAALLADVC